MFPDFQVKHLDQMVSTFYKKISAINSQFLMGLPLKVFRSFEVFSGKKALYL
jgi:hypothetical protein